MRDFWVFGLLLRTRLLTKSRDRRGCSTGVHSLVIVVSCYAKSDQECLTSDKASAAKDYIERQRKALEG